MDAFVSRGLFNKIVFVTPRSNGLEADSPTRFLKAAKAENHRVARCRTTLMFTFTAEVSQKS